MRWVILGPVPHNHWIKLKRFLSKLSQVQAMMRLELAEPIFPISLAVLDGVIFALKY